MAAGVDPADFGPGVIPLDLRDSFGLFAIVDEVTEEPVFQGFVAGDLVLDAASTTDGVAVTGSITGEIFVFPY